MNVKAATDHDWRALECVRTNGIGGTIRLMRTRPGGEECTTFLQEVNPSVVIGNVGPAESGVEVQHPPTRTHTTATELRTVMHQRSTHPGRVVPDREGGAQSKKV